MAHLIEMLYSREKVAAMVGFYCRLSMIRFVRRYCIRPCTWVLYTLCTAYRASATLHPVYWDLTIGHQNYNVIACFPSSRWLQYEAAWTSRTLLFDTETAHHVSKDTALLHPMCAFIILMSCKGEISHGIFLLSVILCGRSKVQIA